MIAFNPATGIFHIRTAKMSYVFKAADDGSLVNLYWGGAVAAEDLADLIQESFHSSFDQKLLLEKEEFGCWNGRSYTEACLKVDSGTNRYLMMRYVDHDISEETAGVQSLRIYLKDDLAGVHVELNYEVYAEYDILSRKATITNVSKSPILLENVSSAALHLPELSEYSLRYLTGKWAGEFQIEDIPIRTGNFVMQSKRGITGPHFNPCFALSEGVITEQHGEVWFGMLAYSGNWKISVEKTIFNHVKVVGGIQDFDFSYRLESNQSFTTPAFTLGYAREGYGDMSRKLHRYERHYIARSTDVRRVLYNSWEATAFQVNVHEQMKLAEKAALMGVELFVVDDGWFGERNHDRAGLGDWYANPTKFPNGLDELITRVNELGMDFGIWVEPEAVNPDSELYREHPDWIYRIDGIEPMQARNQYVLNLGMQPVRQYIKAFLHDLLQKHTIRFLKWDMNRPFTDVGVGGGRDRKLWYEHVMGLYEILCDIRKSFPHVEIETCSGGGGRIDLGILQLSDQCWPSDNTDPYERLFIQEGFTQFYTPLFMMCWVTDTPAHANKAPRSLSYKFHSAMAGGLGIGANINLLADDEIEQYHSFIQLYKEIRRTIQFGDVYRLYSPRHSSFSAVAYRSHSLDEVIVMAFLHTQQYGDPCPRLKLQGLDEERLYEVVGTGKSYYGSTLMRVGLQTNLRGDYDSLLIRLRRRLC